MPGLNMPSGGPSGTSVTVNTPATAGLSSTVQIKESTSKVAAVAGGASYVGQNSLAQSIAAGAGSSTLIDQTNPGLAAALESQTASAVNMNASLARAGFQFAGAQIDNALSASRDALTSRPAASSFLKILVIGAVAYGAFIYLKRG